MAGGEDEWGDEGSTLASGVSARHQECCTFFFFWLTLIVTRYNSPEHVPHACPNAEYSKVPHLIERQDQKLLLLSWSLDLMF